MYICIYTYIYILMYKYTIIGGVTGGVRRAFNPKSEPLQKAWILAADSDQFNTTSGVSVSMSLCLRFCLCVMDS